MIVIKPYIFKKFPEITFGFSTMIGNNASDKRKFNLSFNVGDDAETVKRNRTLFFGHLGLSVDDVAYQKQIHGDTIKFVSAGGHIGESDAMITSVSGIGLAISTADCCAIFIYDQKNKIISAVHSGWRGTSKRILEKTIIKLKEEFKSNPEDLFCYLGPSISQQNYEVGEDVAEQFDKKYLRSAGAKYLLDVSECNYEMLVDNGIKQSNIQKSVLCSYGYNSLLHSYRRDKENSGRALGIIAMTDSP
jgi:YfiH family protein